MAQGTTVLVCNFANPELILAYQYYIDVPGIDALRRMPYVFTYKSPSRTSEAYQLAIIPGRGVDLSAVHMEVMGIWKRWGSL